MEMKPKKIAYVLLDSLLIISIFIIVRLSPFYTTLNFTDRPIKDTLRLVTDYSPVGYFVQGDTIAGINYDLIQLFQTYTPLKLEIVLESSLEKTLEGLSEDKYDIIARGLPITTDLKDKVLLSEPITQTLQVLVQRKQEYNDSILPVRSHLDLAKKEIHIPKYSPNILRIKNLSKEIGDTILFIEDDLYGEEQLAIMVAKGEIDFTVCDEKIAKRIASLQPELDIATNMGFTQLEAWGVNKNTPYVLDSLNLWIERAKQNKELDKIYKRYLDKK